jgi:hypothetical protein
VDLIFLQRRTKNLQSRLRFLGSEPDNFAGINHAEKLAYV